MVGQLNQRCLIKANVEVGKGIPRLEQINGFEQLGECQPQGTGTDNFDVKVPFQGIVVTASHMKQNSPSINKAGLVGGLAGPTRTSVKVLALVHNEATAMKFGHIVLHIEIFLRRKRPDR